MDIEVLYMYMIFALSMTIIHVFLGFSSRRWYVVLGALFPDFDYILATDLGDNIIFGHRMFFPWFGWLFFVPILYKYCKDNVRDFVYGVVVCHFLIDMFSGSFMGIDFWQGRLVVLRFITVLGIFASVFVYNWFFYRRDERQISRACGLPCSPQCSNR